MLIFAKNGRDEEGNDERMRDQALNGKRNKVREGKGREEKERPPMMTQTSRQGGEDEVGRI